MMFEFEGSTQKTNPLNFEGRADLPLILLSYFLGRSIHKERSNSNVMNSRKKVNG